LLGERQPEIYGTQTLGETNELISTTARELGIEIEFAQSNIEGEIVDAIQNARKTFNAIVINPGAYSHYSLAIADAIASINIPVIEVHLSNIAGREDERRTSVTAAACKGSISGFGAQSYVLALHAASKIQGK
jgi:3-dehydroquinate dehydratase-2